MEKRMSILGMSAVYLSFGYCKVQSLNNMNNIDSNLGSIQPVEQHPIRNLTWGQVNIIHTTDTHGWLPGHLLEPNFGADWGDFHSFVSHMKEEGNKRGVDVLLIDTGDRHDGNGLSDATVPKGILIEKLFTYQDYDLLTVGNHELYDYDVALSDYLNIGKYFEDRYVVSNVDLLINGTWKPMGNRYRRFKTKNQNLNIIAYGFMFNFFGNNNQSRVTLVENAVKEDWFQESLAYNDTDVFVVATHIPIQLFPEMYTIIKEIRKEKPDSVIQVLGGHSHVRDYVVIDEKTTALESGRFMETIGWASIGNIDRSHKDNNVTFSRQYIDTNLHSYSYHTNTSLSNEPGKAIYFTNEGLEISKEIKEYRNNLQLDFSYGYVSNNYYLNRARYPGPNNLYSLLEEKVLPKLIGTNVSLNRSLSHPRYILLNTGSIRFDLLKGPYTNDSIYIVSPFENNWQYFPDVPLKYAKQLRTILNRLPYILAADADIDECHEGIIRGEPGNDVGPYPLASYYSEINSKNQLMRSHIYNSKDNHHKNHQKQDIVSYGDTERITTTKKGYRTCDDLGCDGDDTIHDGWDFFPIPNIIQGSQNIQFGNESSVVDVVFYDFIGPLILDAFNTIGYHKNTYLPYGGLSCVELLTDMIINVCPTCEKIL